VHPALEGKLTSQLFNMKSVAACQQKGAGPAELFRRAGLAYTIRATAI